jgi:hypothetical protein
MAQEPQQPEPTKQWSQVVARAWSDDAFKQRLLADPQAVLAEAGLPVPANLQLEVHEATPTHLHLVLPPPPQGRAGEKLSEADLEEVAGGGFLELNKWIRQTASLASPDAQKTGFCRPI